MQTPRSENILTTIYRSEKNLKIAKLAVRNAAKLSWGIYPNDVSA